MESRRESELSRNEREYPIEVLSAGVGSCVLFLPRWKLRVECQRSETLGISTNRLSSNKDYYYPAERQVVHSFFKEYCKNDSELRAQIATAALLAMDTSWQELRKKRALKRSKQLRKKEY